MIARCASAGVILNIATTKSDKQLKIWQLGAKKLKLLTILAVLLASATPASARITKAWECSGIVDLN